MSRNRKLGIGVGAFAFAVVALTALILGVPAFVSSASSASHEVLGCSNEKLTSLIIARDSDGNDIDPDSIDPDSYDGFMFRLKDSAPDTYHSKAVLADFEGRITYRESSGLYVAKTLDDIDDFVDEDYISRIEPDYYMTVADLGTDADGSTTQDCTPTPNDPEYSSYQWNLDMMNVSGAWQNGLYGQKFDENDTTHVKVAVVDSGVVGTGSTSSVSGTQEKHEDLDYSHILTGVNVVNTQSGTPDTLGHGTFITGLIAAQMNNGIGITGIMPEVDIYPVKIFEGRSTSTDTVVEGIKKAVEADADVINLSLGGEGTTEELEEACDDAVASGAIVVAAAGNDGASTPNYPAAYDNVIGVASLDKDKTPSYFSQYGTSVYVAAPGGNVRSLSIDFLSGGDKYETGSGTSYACPEVVALGAMARSVFPDMSQSDFMEMLQETSEDLGEEGFDKYFGYGLVDFEASGKYLLERAYLPWYTLRFALTDQDGADLDGVSVKLTAAEDISWDDDADAGIKKGTWKKGQAIEASADGSYALHKGRYVYELSKDGYFTKTGTVATYSEQQTERVSLEKTYQVKLNIIDSESDKVESAEVEFQRLSDSLSVKFALSDADGAYGGLAPAGTYKYSVSSDGYENATGYVNVDGSLEKTIVMRTSGEVSHVSLECRVAGDDEGSGELIDGASITIVNTAGEEIPADLDGSYQLERGARYFYTATRAGYEDETGKFKVEDEEQSTVTIQMKAAAYYVVLSAVDEDGEELDAAEMDLVDEDGNAVSPVKTNSFKFNLQRGMTYTYTVNCGGYGTETGSFEVFASDIYREMQIVLEAATAKLHMSATDESGNAIGSLSTSVYSASGELQAPAADDEWNLAPGTYTAQAFSAGYKPLTSKFTMTGTEKELKLTLAEDQGEASAFAGGTGTQDDPYLIANETQLRSIVADTSLLGKSYRLLTDIVLGDDAWTPIGHAADSQGVGRFTGSFDGGGHTVSNLSVSAAQDNGVGFFGVVRSAKIRNLKVEGQVRGGQYTGGIVGGISYVAPGDNDNCTEIRNCSFSGQVRGGQYTGGIAGYIDASASSYVNVYIEGCAHDGDAVRSDTVSNSYASYVGGVIGAGSAVQISSCYNSSDVNGSDYIGGIAGAMAQNTSTLNCYNVGTVTPKSSTASRKGGVIGYLLGGSADHCYCLIQSTGNVNGAIGEAKSASAPAATVRRQDKETMQSSGFVDMLNLKSDVAGHAFSAVESSYPELSWKLYSTERFSAEQPSVTEQPCGASYEPKVSATPLNSKATLSSGGELSYQWYSNDIASTREAEPVEGASGTIASGDEVSCTPSTDEVGDKYYFVRFTNSFSDSAGRKYRSSSNSEFAKISVTSSIKAQEPQIQSVAITSEDASGSGTDEGTYTMGEETTDSIVVQATSLDDGDLSYQWFKSAYVNRKGSPIKNATSASCEIDTSQAGTCYYYVAVTNTKTVDSEVVDRAKAKSARIKVNIRDIFTISYQLNGGQLEDAPESYTEGVGCTLVSPQREGYTFEGWYTDSAFSADSAITRIGTEATGDITLYAKWTLITEPINNAQVSLAAKSLVYTGRALAPKVTVTLQGTQLCADSDYELSYSNNKRVGTASVCIAGKGKYTGSIVKSFTINPKAVTKLKLKKLKKGFKASWAKRTTQTSGFEIRYGVSKKKASKAKAAKIATSSAKSKKVKKLKAKKRYYVQMRAYKVVNGKKFYSSWSALKSVKTK